ncbi:hypothetical protein COCC4DRAFT_60898 [Bipolaris maydis ATCC 48331]|uniref:Uncharacterized protein n=2 Tax=Cochliobolus heterostrophus TaxID=5016 RepID=M2TRS4_COCH5|nr:uncharacterized protein COCC4DRAFT_60898 [Bipolaris maydis ATCC 48331]EMD89219.1 hypothetical protein COCHEDRAFT_1107707 [Bipolaris maydis C5]ENI05064.1 hypothetical protein COCC4DRAFT_60898 [Bipolaris maydis ATCC 48331]KAJ6212579.1 hypothetical protein PSV09DRAFT_1107707 [Bipolaris maydis]
MLLQLLLVALVCCPISAYASPISPVFQRRRPLESSPVESQHSLSVEAIIGIAAIAVAVLGIALPLIWPSVRSWPCRLRFRLSAASYNYNMLFLNRLPRCAIPSPPPVTSHASDRAAAAAIPRSQRARFDHSEQHRELMRRALTS